MLAWLPVDLPFRLPRLSLRAMAIGAAIGLAAFVVLAAAVTLSVYGYFQVSERILTGVRVGEIDLGNRTVEEAAGLLDSGWTVDQRVHLSDGVSTWSTSATALGVSIDAGATARRAFDVGHGQGFITELSHMLDALLGGYAVAPHVIVDSQAARAELERWVEPVYRPPTDATIRIEGGQVVPVPGIPGQMLNVDGTLARLVYDPDSIMQTGQLPLALDPVQPAIADPGPAVAEAEAILSRSLTVALYDPITDERIEWVEAREVVASWLGVETTDSGPRVAVVEDRLAAYVDGLDGRLGQGRFVEAGRNTAPLTAALRGGGPAVLVVSHSPTTYTVQPGDTLTRVAWNTGIPYWRILQANPGINPDVLAVGQVVSIPSADDLLPLPVVPHKRVVVSISQQRMWAYENGQMLQEYIISTGIADSPTQPGVFQVQSHEINAYASAWDLHMPNFIGIYEAWPGFMNGFHGLPTRGGGQVLWAGSLGRPVSYGCIILDNPNVQWLYDWADDGVVVEIRE
jgi:lipoprotein-anchoring transpeptidase ErfK/SrfK